LSNVLLFVQYSLLSVVLIMPRQELIWSSSSRFNGIIMRQTPPRNAGIAWNTVLLPYLVGAMRIRPF